MSDSSDQAGIYDVMSTQRAVRRLRPDPIPTEVLERVLQAACWAPTGGNAQPWRIVVATDPDVKRALAAIYAPEWASYSSGFIDRLSGLPPEQLDPWKRVVAAGDYLAEHMAEAPAILVFCANLEMMAITDADLDRTSIVGGGSVYPAVQNAMLACVNEGLGCTITTLHCIREGEVIDLLGIPKGWATAALVPIGYPVGKGHGPLTRQSPSVLAFRDRFGQAWS